MSSKGRKLNALEQRIHQAALAATDMVCVFFVSFLLFLFCCDCFVFSVSLLGCMSVCGAEQRDLGRGRRKITELPTDFLAYHLTPLSLILTRLFTHILIWSSGYLTCSTYLSTYLLICVACSY